MRWVRAQLDQIAPHFEHGGKQIAAAAISIVLPDQIVEHIAITGDHPFAADSR